MQQNSLVHSKAFLESHNQGKYAFESEARSLGYTIIAGVDEAGRGPLAGPLVVASCILPEGIIFSDIDDSKKLSEEKREELYHQIVNHPQIFFAVSIIQPDLIDKINILQATLLGMQQSVDLLKVRPDFVLVDGNRSPKFPMPSKAVIKGDSLSYSIGAASIIAKVTRDRIMVEYHREFPEYGFAKHKGYPTESHRRVLSQIGPSPIHRRSYAPVQAAMALFANQS